MHNILAQLPPELTGVFTEKNLKWAILAWFIVTNAGRFYSAVRNGGGLRGIYRGLIFGENTPKAVADDYKPEKPV
jgi:hypothetical protein